jgi:hypothetical protein
MGAPVPETTVINRARIDSTSPSDVPSAAATLVAKGDSTTGPKRHPLVDAVVV